MGRIIKIRPHPYGDRIWLADVEIGPGHHRQIVWGGLPILDEGDLVPVAPPGSRLPQGKMRRRRYRGEVSEGMLCSLAELGWDLSVSDRVALLDERSGLAPGESLDSRESDWPSIVPGLDVFVVIKAQASPFPAVPVVPPAGQAPDDEQHHQDRHQRGQVRQWPGEGGVVAKAVLAVGEDDEADEDADQDRGGHADPHGGRRAARGQAGHGGPVPRQVGEQNGQVFAGPGLPGLARPLVELVGGEPASRAVLA